MARTTRPEPTGPSAGGIIAAAVVVAVLIILGVVLVNSRPVSAPTTTDTTAVADTGTTTTRRPLPEVSSVPAEVAARNEQYSAAPEMTIDTSKSYTATITTPAGDIVIQLRPDVAPETVNNFVFLAREGYYNGVPWHRVLDGFMAQTGDPTGTGTGGPGYTINDEFSSTLSFDRPGLVAMAKTSAPNSAGSQFFITTAPATWLDGQYTIFGEVTSGQEIVDAIPLRDPEAAPASIGEQITSITITES